MLVFSYFSLYLQRETNATRQVRLPTYLSVLHGNLGLLRESMSRIAYRLVYVETLQAEKVISQLQDLGINAFELLKCHSLAKSKYDKLGIPFMDYTPSDTAYNVFYRKMLEAGLQIVKHEI